MLIRMWLAVLAVAVISPTAWGQFTFRQGSANAARPAFGNTSGSASGIRFGFGNNPRFRIGISAEQGSSRSMSMSAPMAVFQSPGIASFSNSSFRPFVTGLTPFVSTPGWNRFNTPPVAQPFVEAEDDLRMSRDEVRDARRQRYIARLERKAEHQKRTGRPGMARVYYRMALKRAVGEIRDTITAKIDELELE